MRGEACGGAASVITHHVRGHVDCFNFVMYRRGRLQILEQPADDVPHFAQAM